MLVMHKVSTLLVLLCCAISCVICSSACLHEKTWNNSLATVLNSLSIGSTAFEYEIVWEESTSGNLEVSVIACSNSTAEYDALAFFVGELANNATIKLEKIIGNLTEEVFNATISVSNTTTIPIPTIPYPRNSTNSTANRPPPSSGTVVVSSADARPQPGLFLLILAALASLSLFNKRISILVSILCFTILVPHATANETKITIRVKVPPTMNTFCVQGSCFDRSSNGQVTSYVSIFGRRYAALDSLYETPVCDISRIMQLPNGWTIAKDDEITHLAIDLHDWQAYALVVNDGSAYQNLKYKIEIQDSVLGIVPNYFGEGVDGYHVKYCDYRVLITQDFPIPDSTRDIVSVPTITNFVSLAGYDYAVADNSAYGDTALGCQKGGVFLDSASEWQLAPDDDAALVVRHSPALISYGTECVVFSNGKAYNSDLSLCGSSALVVFAFRTGTLYTVSSCNKRIMIRRPSVSIQSASWDSKLVITNEYYHGEQAFASLDNANPLDLSVKGCQDRFLEIPDGWRLATHPELVSLIAAAGFRAWPSTVCLATVGAASDHNGQKCETSLISKTVGTHALYNTNTCGRVIITRALSKKTTFSIGMKLLLLSASPNTATDVALNLALTMFTAVGVTYDWLYLRDSNGNPTIPGNLPLYDSQQNPKYYAIVLTDGRLSYVDTDGTSKTALTPEQQAELNLYKYTYSVRLVALTTYPNPALGVSFLDGGVPAPPGTRVTIDPSFAATHPDVVAGINTAASYDISGVYHTAVTFAPNVSPFLRYVTQGETPTAYSKVAAALIVLPDGTEELHFFIGNSVTSEPGPLLASVWLNWVTKGTWVGNRRVYLSPQVDDLFLSTEQFDTKIPARASGDDLRQTKNFLDAYQAKLPAGSSVTAEFGFNGAGVTKIRGTNTVSDSLFDAVREFADKFYWESHTYTHEDLTCPAGNCRLYGPTTYEQVSTELIKNINFTANSLFKGLGGLATPTYSPRCMITPKITGLFNPNALRAMHDNGIACVVGDNSVPALIPANKYHPLITTTEVNGFDGIYIIPRFPTEIYYDTALPTAQVSEYNFRYGIGGVINSASADKTLDEILKMEADRTVRNLLLFRHDPYMFHQGNLIHFEYTKADDTQARSWSLLTLWIQSITDKYLQYMSLPLVTLQHEALWETYKQRMARDTCGINAVMHITDGDGTNVGVSTSGVCEVAITGLGRCSNTPLLCRAEVYGPDTTVWVKMDHNYADLPSSVKWL